MMHLLIPLLSISSTAPQLPAWIGELVQQAPPSPSFPPAPKAQRLIAVLAPPDAVRNSAGMFVSDHLIDVYEPSAEPNHDEEDRFRIESLLDRRQYEAAYRQAQKIPWGGEMAINEVPFSVSAILTGRYETLEALLVAYLRRYGKLGNNFDLQLSIATAMRGRVYGGQGTYVGDALTQEYANKNLNTKLTERLCSPVRPKDVAVTSLLVLGLRSGMPYSTGCFELALSLDPKCGIAAERLMDEYRYTGQFADSARIGWGILPSIPAGPLRASFQAKLDLVKGRPNGPLRERRSKPAVQP